MSFISGRQVAMTRTTVRFGTTVRVMQCDERRSAAAASVLSERNAALLEDDQPAQPVESRARIATRDLLSDRSFPPQHNEKFFSHLFPQSVFASLFFSLASFEKIHENLSQFGKRTKRKEGGSSNLLT